jgi:hypothetical protein
MTWVALGTLIFVLAWPLAYWFLRDNPTDLGLLPDGDLRAADGSPAHPGPAAPGPLETDT